MTADRRPAHGSLLGRGDVMEGALEMIDGAQIEGTFPDGTKLVTIHHRIR